MGFMELFAKGGPVMYVLFALSIYVTAVILFKLYQFWAFKLHSTAFVAEVFNYLHVKNMAGAQHAAHKSPSPLARVVESALASLVNPYLTDDAKEEQVQLAGNAQIRRLESHMRGLELSANIAPLLGLLGTVTGMVAAFATLEHAGSKIDPSILAGGIWEALLTTAFGLCIAIPAMAAHYIIDAQIEKMRYAMEENSTRILALDHQSIDAIHAA